MNVVYNLTPDNIGGGHLPGSGKFLRFDRPQLFPGENDEIGEALLDFSIQDSPELRPDCVQLENVETLSGFILLH